MITCGTQVVAGNSGGGASLSDATPLVESGAGSAGSSSSASRADHVHPAAGGSSGTLYIGGESATGFAAADYATASAAAAVPAFGPGQSLVACLYPRATPTGQEIIAAHIGGAGVRGWYLACGNNAGARRRLSLWLYGLGAAGGLEFLLTSSDFTVDSAYVIAICMKADKSTRYSVNGGSVQVISAQSGTYTAPSSADTYDLGSTRAFTGVPATYPFTSGNIGEVRTYSTEISDADLVAACADRTSGTIPDVATGTVSTRFLPSDFAGGVRVKAQTGVTWVMKGGASVRPA
jgi:hypothetical protein